MRFSFSITNGIYSKFKYLFQGPRWKLGSKREVFFLFLFLFVTNLHGKHRSYGNNAKISEREGTQGFKSGPSSSLVLGVMVESLDNVKCKVRVFCACLPPCSQREILGFRFCLPQAGYIDLRFQILISQMSRLLFPNSHTFVFLEWFSPFSNPSSFEMSQTTRIYYSNKGKAETIGM